MSLTSDSFSTFQPKHLPIRCQKARQLPALSLQYSWDSAHKGCPGGGPRPPSRRCLPVLPVSAAARDPRKGPCRLPPIRDEQTETSEQAREGRGQERGPAGAVGLPPQDPGPVCRQCCWAPGPDLHLYSLWVDSNRHSSGAGTWVPIQLWLAATLHWGQPHPHPSQDCRAGQDPGTAHTPLLPEGPWPKRRQVLGSEAEHLERDALLPLRGPKPFWKNCGERKGFPRGRGLPGLRAEQTAGQSPRRGGRHPSRGSRTCSGGTQGSQKGGRGTPGPDHKREG